MKYTDGPLTVHGPSPGRGAFDDGGDYCIRDQHGKIIGEAIRLVGHGDDRPAEGNAKLWAAAPKMLNALRNIEAIMCDKALCGHFIPEEIREEIRIATEGL